MTKTSGASLPGFDSKDIRNLPAMEVVAGSGQTPRITCVHASADQGEAMTRQCRAVVTSRGDSSTDQANLIRDWIREEMRRGLGRLSRPSEREGSVSSSSSHKGSRSSRSRSVRHSRSLSSLCDSRSSGKRSYCSHAPSHSSHVSGGSSRTPPPPYI